MVGLRHAAKYRAAPRILATYATLPRGNKSTLSNLIAAATSWRRIRVLKARWAGDENAEAPACGNDGRWGGQCWTHTGDAGANASATARGVGNSPNAAPG